MSMFDTKRTGSSESARFRNPGDTVSGRIVKIGDPIQQNRFGTKEPDFWPSGDPKMVACITLQTDQRDPGIEDDDGLRGLWVLDAFARNPTSQLGAIITAVRNAGAKTLEVGGTLTFQMYGFDPNSQNPANPKKMYRAKYEAPPAAGGMFDDDGDDWAEEEQQAAAQAQRNAAAQPAPAPQAAQQAPAADDREDDPAPAPAPAQQAQAAPGGGVDPAKAAQIVAMVNLGLEDDAIASALGEVTAQQVAAFRA